MNSSDSSQPVGTFRDRSPSHGDIHLPAQSTSFIGREVEIALARRLLASTRLLTLTGPGGSGKTRLALTIAKDVGPQFMDGVVFVSLAPINDPQLVMSTITTTLGIAPAADQPLIENLKRFLARRHLLLILDNFEQVQAAAPLVSDLLSTCPRLTVLVTSRISLHLTGEQELPVPPLPVPEVERAPDLAVLSQNSAVSLFVGRARAINPAFLLTENNATHVAEICRRLDGLPLAIELAAARLRLLTPQAISQRLDRQLPLLIGGARDAPARQQTMRDSIAWSYDLLPSHEQRLFRHLSIFAGGWTLDAAEALSGGESDVLNGMTTLIDQNLIYLVEQASGCIRYEMQEAIREFGLERLEFHDEDEPARHRHARYFVALAAWFEQQSVTGATVTTVYDWYNHVTSEQNNMRVALEWALEREPDTALRIAAGLAGFWFYHDDWWEGRRWLRAALDRTMIPTRARLQALGGAGSLATWQGDYDEAQRLHKEALELSQDLDNWYGIVLALHGLGRIAHCRGEVAQAVALYEETLAWYRDIPIDGFVTAVNKAATLGNLGELHLGQGQIERASDLLMEAVALCRKHDARQIMFVYLNSLGRAALQRGDVTGARQMFAECLIGNRDFGWKMRFVESLENVASLALAEHEELRSARLLGAADSLRHDIGYVAYATERLYRDRDVVVARRALGDEAFESAWREGRAMTVADAISEALDCLDGESRHQKNPPSTLSRRELDVLRLLVEGKSDREIAGDLFISHHTVMRHVSNILNKLGVESRTGAAAHAIRHSLV